MKKLIQKLMWSLVGVCFLLLILYLGTRSTPIIEWNDFIQIRGVGYGRCGKYPLYTEVPADQVGEKIGKVTRRPPTIYTDIFGNTYPKLKDGTAYGCPIGTEVFAVIGCDDAIAALIGRTYYLYTTGPNS